jgi:hypothetical protein
MKNINDHRHRYRAPAGTCVTNRNTFKRFAAIIEH